MRKSNSTVRNSRWSDAPILDRSGRPKVAVVTERDIERIFLPLARYRYLPADYLHAFAGGSLDYLINRLALLARKPNCYVARPQQQRANASANCRRQIYELADKGIRVIHEHGLMCSRPRTPTNFAHELMTCQLMASFALGVRETGNRLIAWSDILERSNGVQTAGIARVALVMPAKGVDDPVDVLLSQAVLWAVLPEALRGGRRSRPAAPYVAAFPSGTSTPSAAIGRLCPPSARPSSSRCAPTIAGSSSP